jgi:hypothetical protein
MPHKQQEINKSEVTLTSMHVKKVKRWSFFFLTTVRYVHLRFSLLISPILPFETTFMNSLQKEERWHQSREKQALNFGGCTTASRSIMG